MRKAKWVALFAAIAGAVGFIVRRRRVKDELPEMGPSEFRAA